MFWLSFEEFLNFLSDVPAWIFFLVLELPEFLFWKPSNPPPPQKSNGLTL